MVRCAWLLLSFAVIATCEAAPPDSVLRTYQEARSKHEAKPQDVKLAWEYGRACFDVAEFATNNAQRAELANQGIDSCRKALALDGKSAPAHYYLGLNLGQLARTRGLGALKLIKEMERAWIAADEINSRFDQAGPARSLGMLYRDAPPIASVGSRSKAKRQFTRAVELAPKYPENRLELIETYLQWNDRPAARRELEALERVLPAAREEFKAPAWASSWKQWDSRFEKLKRKSRNFRDSKRPGTE